MLAIAIPFLLKRGIAMQIKPNSNSSKSKAYPCSFIICNFSFSSEIFVIVFLVNDVNELFLK